MSHPSFDVTARLAQLFVYPIKSCAGIAVQEAVVTDMGLEWDRNWMVVDDQWEFVSQRELPRMALVQPKLRVSDMVLRAPGMLALHVALDAVEKPVRARVWSDEVDAFDMGDTAAQWFSDFLGQKLRLVRFDPDFRRVCDRQWTPGQEAITQFADGFPILVASEASLAGLNARLVAKGQEPVSMVRFRPNVVVDGVEAHDEDRLDALQIDADDGPVTLKPVKPCARCPIPNVDPLTALSSPDVGDALQAYRQDDRVNGAVTFGMNALVVEGAERVLRVGQAVSGNYVF